MKKNRPCLNGLVLSAPVVGSHGRQSLSGPACQLCVCVEASGTPKPRVSKDSSLKRRIPSGRPCRGAIKGQGETGTSDASAAPRLNPQIKFLPMRARFLGSSLKVALKLGRMRVAKNCCGGKRSRNWWTWVRPSNGIPVAGLVARLGTAFGGENVKAGSTAGFRSGRSGGDVVGGANASVGGLHPGLHSPGLHPPSAQARRPALWATEAE